MNANLTLSPEEMRLVTDPAWILTKNSVMGKVVGMMARLSAEFVAEWAQFRSGGASAAGAGGTTEAGGARTADAGDIARAGAIRAVDPGSPKISRGENYRGLPWVMLDHPRVFGRKDVLAIRTMFWWGHTFSVTLHLKGRWLDLCLPVIEARRDDLAAAGFHAGIGDDEWRHEHDPENYRALTDVAELSGGRAFLKLSAAVGLDRWAEAPAVMKGWYEVLCDVLGETGQMPEKDA